MKMYHTKIDSRGFTLIASLLLVAMMSGMAIALLMMVNTEQRVGGFDLNNTYTYHAAEGAIEKMTSDVASTFKSIQSPTASQICALSNNYPTWDSTITYQTYNISPIPTSFGVNPCSAAALAANPNPTTAWGQIQSGPNAGLYAQLIPITMNVVAQRGTGETVSMTRTAEVALIPVFQFGVFSDSDLFFGRSPNLGFAGRVHTNGDLYLGVADGYNLVFGDKISAFGNVIRQQMDNGVVASGNDDGGTVMIPTQASGCAAEMANVAGATASATCVDIALTALGASLGSVTGGHGSAQNTASWKSVSTGTYQGYLIDGNGQANGTDGPNSTGATDLTLPFVNGTTNAVQVIRLPPASENITSVLGQNREANMAQIRILLADNEPQLHLNDWNGDITQDYQLVSMLPTALQGLPQGSSGGTQPQAGIVVPSAGANTYYFGESYCTGATYVASTTIGAAYSAVDSNVTIAGSGANKVVSNYSGTTTRACPTLTGSGTMAGTIGTLTDPNFVIPQYYGPVSNGPGGAALTPTAFPAPAAFTTANNGTNGLEWPLINGWLLVEVKFASDQKWHGVTKEWLQLGFARGLQVPTQPGTPYTAPASNAQGVYGSNFIQDHKDAILYFQQTADRNGNNSITGTGAGTDLPITANFYGAGSQYNWYPINLYDAREGENNDAAGTFAATTGTPNGILNVVELDVGNLRNWLLGTTGSNGTKVDFVAQNGYVLYFSDRRGMQFATAAQGANYQGQWGEYGYEDTVNYANAGSGFAPNGALDPVNYNGVSAEDVNGNLVLDKYGVKYVGDAFGPQTTADTDTAAIPSPYALGHRINTFTIGRANRVTGARHALKLVDGSLGNLPTMPAGNATNNCSQSTANPTGCGGFTVASENPVYIQGNYNSNCIAAGSNCTSNNANYDATWTGGAEPVHAAASVIADAVTLLSNNWQDVGCTPSGGACTAALNTTTGSLLNPINPGGQSVPAQTPNRIATSTYYRVAIAAGKNIAFVNTAQNPEFAYGMDGGVHNFLRFIEDWGGPASAGGQQQLYYKGSIVSLYWGQYATGPFKCCNLVYNPPDRQYTFDSLFALPQNLPPGTPMFRNVDNLTYRQNQVARTN
jgi:Tfp pilus assembly protein PilX